MVRAPISNPKLSTFFFSVVEACPSDIRNLQRKSNVSLSYAEILGHDMFTSTVGHFHSGLTYQDYKSAYNFDILQL